MSKYRRVRLAAGWSLSKAAALADVSPGLARIFEIKPGEVRDLAKRRSLMRLYDDLALCVGSSAAE